MAARVLEIAAMRSPRGCTLSRDEGDGERFSMVLEELVERRKEGFSMVPKIHVRNVRVGTEGLFVVGTVRATHLMGEFSRSSGDGVIEQET